MPFPYLNCHANCWAITLILTGWFPALLFCARTTALTIAIAVTRIVGITVQTISIVVCPWIGGPSDQSPGSARKLMIE